MVKYTVVSNQSLSLFPGTAAHFSNSQNICTFLECFFSFPSFNLVLGLTTNVLNQFQFGSRILLLLKSSDCVFLSNKTNSGCVALETSVLNHHRESGSAERSRGGGGTGNGSDHVTYEKESATLGSVGPIRERHPCTASCRDRTINNVGPLKYVKIREKTSDADIRFSYQCCLVTIRRQGHKQRGSAETRQNTSEYVKM